MKVLYVTENLRDADFLEHELRQSDEAFEVDVSPDPQDALRRLTIVGHDVVLVDGSPAQRLNSIIQIHREKPSLAILLLIGPREEDPPLGALKAGANDYVVKKPDYVKFLPDTIKRVTAQKKEEVERTNLPIRVLYAGHDEVVRRYLAQMSSFHLETADFAPDGSGLMVGAEAPCEVALLDETLPHINVLQLLKEIHLKAPGVPVVLLADTDRDDVVLQALRLGASDCVLKTGDYLARLLLTLPKVVARRDLLQERNALVSTEERLRLVIEFVPTCVILLDGNGTIVAMNWTGLSLIGAARLEEIVGRDFLEFVQEGDRGPMRQFIDKVCAGTRKSTRFHWTGLNGVHRHLESRAVPFRRDTSGAPAMLAVVHDLATTQSRELDANTLSGALDVTRSLADDPSSLADDPSSPPSGGPSNGDSDEVTQLSRALEDASQTASRERAEKARVATELDAIKAKHDLLLEGHDQERQEWERVREELQQRLRAAEEKGRANAAVGERLQEAFARQLEFVEELSVERAKLRTLLKDGQDQQRLVDEESARRIDLEEKLRWSDTKQKQLSKDLEQLRASELGERHEQTNEQIESIQGPTDIPPGAGSVANPDSQSPLAVQSLPEIVQQHLDIPSAIGEKNRLQLVQGSTGSTGSTGDAGDGGSIAEDDPGSISRDIGPAQSGQRGSELERVDVEAQLHGVEDRYRQVLVKHNKERSHWEKCLRDLEQKLRLEREQRNAIEIRLANAEEVQATLEAKNVEERSKWEEALSKEEGLRRRDQERLQSLGTELSTEQQRYKGLVEDYGRTSERLDATFRDMEEEKAERARVCQLLHETEARYEKLNAQRTENFQQLLHNELCKAKQESEASLRIVEARHQEEIGQLKGELDRSKVDYDQQLSRQRESREGLENQIRVVQEQYDRLVKSETFGFAITTLEGRIIRCNDTLGSLLGYSGAESLMRNLHQCDLNDWLARADHRQQLQEAENTTHAEACLRRCDGRAIWLSESAKLHSADDAGTAPHVERIFIDVTEKHHLQDLLFRGRRMEALGRFATATVENFSDLLTSMSSYGDLLVERLDRDHPLWNQAEQHRDMVHRANGLAQQLLSFSRKLDRSPELIEINGVLENMEGILQRLVGTGIEFRQSLDSRAGLISADPQELEQIVSTVTMNARDALSAGGSLTVETQLIEHDPYGSAVAADIPSGPYVLLSITASGFGVQPARNSHALEGMIECSGGFLEVSSDEETGTCFGVYLPRVESGSANRRPSPDPTSCSKSP